MVHSIVPDAPTDGLDMYGGSLALLTDLYQLTMACGYWKAGHSEREAVFHLTYRRPPFQGGYAIAAGIAPAIAFLQRLRFTDEDLAYLATLVDPAGGPLFPAEFLAYLGAMRFSCTVDAVPEGSLVFPHEPIIRVKGPLAQAQLVETPAAHAGQLPDADRDQGRARVPGGARRRRCSSSGCAARRASMAGSARRVPRTSAAAPRPRTCSRASSSGSRSAARTRTAG